MALHKENMQIREALHIVWGQTVTRLITGII